MFLFCKYMYNIFDSSNIFFPFGFAAVLFCCCTVYLKTSSSLFKSLEHIHGHDGNLTWMLKNAFVEITTTQKMQFTLKNVSSCPSCLSNGEIIYKVYIFNNSCLLALLGSWAVTLTTRAVPVVYFI